MRKIAMAGLLSALVAAPAWAQAPAQGKLEIKAYEKIPKTKTAVQLTDDTALGRHLRGVVMAHLARRGNEVGFSGGNVMRMDVGYLDLLGSGGGDSSDATIGGQPSFAPSGSNPRPELPSNRVQRRDLIGVPSKSTLRITLTLYNVTTGKVIWAATSSCGTNGTNVQRTGDIMVETIFKDPDHSQTTDAGCPL